MPQLNKVFIMGNLTRDPELRRIPSGTAVTELGLALNRTFKDKSGEKREEVTFVDVTVWDRQAETCCQHLRKGASVHVEGYLKLHSWDDKATGEKRSRLKVQAESVQFMERSPGQRFESPPPSGYHQPRTATATTTPATTGADPAEDDLPF